MLLAMVSYHSDRNLAKTQKIETVLITKEVFLKYQLHGLGNSLETDTQQKRIVVDFVMANLGCQLSQVDCIWNQINPKLLDTARAGFSNWIM